MEWIKQTYAKVNRFLCKPLRLLDGQPDAVRYVATWIGHGLVTALVTWIGFVLAGPWGAWAGFNLGCGFYAARENFRSWPIRSADVDHFGDAYGPILLGSLLLMLLVA